MYVTYYNWVNCCESSEILRLLGNLITIVNIQNIINIVTTSGRNTDRYNIKEKGRENVSYPLYIIKGSQDFLFISFEYSITELLSK